MYEFAGAGPCPFPGQLQYRVVNPRGAGVFFDKSFQSSAGPALRPGQVVCGTPRMDPSGMSSYVVELANGYANALDFEQLTSAAPAPVLASGALYQLDYVGAGLCALSWAAPVPRRESARRRSVLRQELPVVRRSHAPSRTNRVRHAEDGSVGHVVVRRRACERIRERARLRTAHEPSSRPRARVRPLRR